MIYKAAVIFSVLLKRREFTGLKSYSMGKFTMVATAIVFLTALCFEASWAERPHSWDPVSREHWSFLAVDELVKVRLTAYPSVCYPSFRGWQYDLAQRRYSRLELALQVDRATTLLNRLSVENKPQAEDFKRFEDHFRSLLHYLVLEYKPELMLIDFNGKRGK